VPETTVTWNDLSLSARAALALGARLGGWLCAGTTVLGGKLVRTNAGTLRGLARRGLVTLDLSPDGGMSARLTPAGKALVDARDRLGW
jgi:hypothetical protein